MTFLYRGYLFDSDQIETITTLADQTDKIQNGYENVKGAIMKRGLTESTQLESFWEAIKNVLPPDDNYDLVTGYVLEYNKGDYTLPHRDEAKYTSITLLPCEYEGGDMVVDDQLVDLEVGETVVFDGSMFHEVFLIESGTRKVVVGWWHDHTRS